MNTVALPDATYRLLEQYARLSNQTTDQTADHLLRSSLLPQHPYIEMSQRASGLRAAIKGSRVLVADIVGYLQIGESPETLTDEIMPRITLAQIYDVLSYYHEHREEIDLELSNNTEQWSKGVLREGLDAKTYLRITGQRT